MIPLFGQMIDKDMMKKIFADRFQETVLRLKVRIKGAPPDVCLIDDLLHRDLFITLFRDQFFKCHSLNL